MTYLYGGYQGKILRINLSGSYSSIEETPADLARDFIGGRALGAAMLYQELAAGTDPLGEDNKLIFLTGPLVGTNAPSSARFSINTKSPQTGIYLFSICSGMFGPAIKRAGFDGLIIEGKSPLPVYLLITDKGLTFADAGDLWGLTTDKTEEILKSRHRGQDRCYVASIGPAGENLARVACILSEGRAAGRGGAGAVMGSKHLKAIVVTGNGKVPLSDPRAFKEAVKEARDKVDAAPFLKEGMHKYGSAISIGVTSLHGVLPTRNWQTGVFPKVDALRPQTAREKFLVRDSACPQCPVGCAKIMAVKDGPFAGAITDGPEYETVYAFGSALESDSMESIIYADMLCDQLGMDTISCGATLAWAMECRQRGILSRQDCDGLELYFGNAGVIPEVLRKMALREGIGDLLADGTREAARRLGHGSEKFAMHTKGMELGGYDPRGIKGQALVVACGPRGGCHHAGGYVIALELASGKYDPLAAAGKGEMVKNAREFRVIMDSAMYCAFLGVGFGLDVAARLLQTATGIDFTAQELFLIAERTSVMERLFNVREGLRRKDDTLPDRLLNEPLPEGPAAGQKLEGEFETMVTEFYHACGWDQDAGIPTEATIERLGLKKYIGDANIVHLNNQD